MEQTATASTKDPAQDRYTSKEHWDSYYTEYRPKKVGSVFFAEIFEKYLEPDPAKTVLEVGCAGGEYLCYMARTFGFVPHGVDYSDEIKKPAICLPSMKCPSHHFTRATFSPGNRTVLLMWCSQSGLSNTLKIRVALFKNIWTSWHRVEG